MNDPRVITDEQAFVDLVDSADPAGAADPQSERGMGEIDETPMMAAIRIPVEVRVSVEDPFVAYKRVRDGANGVFLETTGGQSGWGYFGVDPVETLTVNQAARCRNPDSEMAPTLAALEGLLETATLVRGDCDVPYPCGVAGWLSYDIARELEDLSESAVDDRELPRLEMGLFDRFAAWECPTQAGEATTLRVTACPRVVVPVAPSDTTDSHTAESRREIARAAYERGRERALELARTAVSGDPSVGEPPVSDPEATFESDCGRDAFADRVRRVKAYIRDGDTFQANISQRLVAPAAVHPVDAYDALRRVNPAPYSCLLECRAVDLVSASPELLLERDGSFVRTEPIAGTRPRGETTTEDDALEADLLGDEKERAEHAMLVDLERNDLGAVCAYGSVDVEEYRRIDRYSEVMHLVSNVTGSLRPDATLADAIAATFPGGTITGAPKPRTMEIIDELEATQRGPYTGGVAIAGFDGRATINIVIRTLVRYGEAYHLRVGAGIVHDSDPASEYDETLAKARALLNAIDTALGERAGMALEGGLETDGGEPRA